MDWLLSCGRILISANYSWGCHLFMGKGRGWPTGTWRCWRSIFANAVECIGWTWNSVCYLWSWSHHCTLNVPQSSIQLGMVGSPNCSPHLFLYILILMVVFFVGYVQSVHLWFFTHSAMLSDHFCIGIVLFRSKFLLLWILWGVRYVVLKGTCHLTLMLALCRGDFGRLGHGNSSDLFTPQPIKALHGLKIRQIACGDSHCLAVTMEGEVQRWAVFLTFIFVNLPT